MSRGFGHIALIATIVASGGFARAPVLAAGSAEPGPAETASLQLLTGPGSDPAPAAAPDAVVTSTTTTPSTTTTTTPPTTTTAPPALVVSPPAAPVSTVPPPAPAAAAAEPESLQERAERALEDAVPAVWLERIPIFLTIIPGNTSWSLSGGRIEIAESHASGRYEHLMNVVAHEFGHEVAFRYGTGAYPGAAPEGWPAPPDHPEEAWADCVQTVFTGQEDPSHGLAPCRGDALGWTADWLASPTEPTAA